MNYMANWRMPWLVILFLMVGVGCSRDPKNFRITQQNKDKFWEEIKDMKGLTVEETRLLYSCMTRSNKGEASRSAAPEMVGKTIGELIAQQRELEAQAGKEREQQDRLAVQARTKPEAIAQELRKAITLTVLDKSFQPSDPMTQRYDDYLWIKCTYQNISAKDVCAFSGIIRFTDLFGKKIFESNLHVTNRISAGQKASWSGQIVYNQFMDDHQALRNTRLTDMKIIWLPSQILFADGTKIGAE